MQRLRELSGSGQPQFVVAGDRSCGGRLMFIALARNPRFDNLSLLAEQIPVSDDEAGEPSGLQRTQP